VLSTLPDFVRPITVGSVAEAMALVAAFTALLLIGARALPGERVPGAVLSDGSRLVYRVNGLSLWVATHIVVITLSLRTSFSLSILVDRFPELFLVANVAALVWSVRLQASGRRRMEPEARALGPLAKVREFWYGAELNPRWWGIDLKTWAYHPSLIGLSLLNASFAVRQWELYGELTPQMIAYQAFWWLYMTTHFWYERGVLSMWDVIAEKFGFMLVWGDLVLVPFFYCIPGWWILGERRPLGWGFIAGCALVHLLGLWIFRGANAQKDQFKRDPTAPIWGRTPEVVGGRLLASGWWGLGRKINYTGEILVYTSFALCTGFRSLVPWLLPLWLCLLLPHRAWRDEARCRAKYGAVWEEYTRRARFRMIPFVY
jgi:delta14-sterol reductase